MNRTYRIPPLLAFYLIAVTIALVVGPVRSSLMPPAEPGVHALQHLWDWFAEHRVHIDIRNLVRFAADGYSWAWLIFVFAAAPSLAAIVVCGLYGGRKSVAALFRRFRPWLDQSDRPQALRVYAVLLVAYAIGVVVYLVVGRLTGQPDQIELVRDILGDNALVAILIILGGLFLDEGGTLEELGWRGFAMPLLQQRYTPLVAAVLLGVIWWAWHFPREIAHLPENYQSLKYWFGQGQFLVYVIFLSIVITYFVNRCGGSVLPAIMIHGGSNFWNKALGNAVQLDLPVDPRLLLFIAASCIILYISGPRLGLPHEKNIPLPL